jgi:hypothetical protein
MKPGRAFSLLTGVALLGGIAKFNEMTPDAQAAFLGTAADAARAAAQSLFSNTVETHNGNTQAAQPAAEPIPAQTRAVEVKDEAPALRKPAVQTADVSTETPSGNPLWTLPLTQLSMTRDRPIFSPSRHPPPPPPPPYVAPVAVRKPVKPAEPERPAVQLLGTIIGSGADDRIGVFLEAGTNNIVRMRAGEDHRGWVLRLIKTREVTLVKDGEQAVVLELPAPGDAPPPGLSGMMPGAMLGTAAGLGPMPAVQPPQPSQGKPRRR